MFGEWKIRQVNSSLEEPGNYTKAISLAMSKREEVLTISYKVVLPSGYRS